jgi:Tfp pilus assembly protein PilF
VTPKASSRDADSRRLDPYRRLGLTPQASPSEIEKQHRKLVGFLADAPAGLRGWAEAEKAAAGEAYATLRNPARARRSSRPSPTRRLALGTLMLLVAVAVVVGVYELGSGKGGGSAQTSEASANSLSPAQEARIAGLMQKLRSKPKDPAVLVQLGNAFFGARDYKSASEWMQRALAADPKNVNARLALGAAQFNLGNEADAKRQWLRAVAMDPKSVEAYYDLGFLYVSGKRPDLAKAKEMWGKVIALSPNSPVAKTVVMHLKSLEKTTSKSTSPAGGGR